MNLEEEVESRTAELRNVNEELKSQIAQRERAEERIRRLAYYDGLTGLPNRQLFQERLEKAIETARRVGGPVGLLGHSGGSSTALLSSSWCGPTRRRISRSTGRSTLAGTASRARRGPTGRARP